jgi:hypothetical protein
MHRLEIRKILASWTANGSRQVCDGQSLTDIRSVIWVKETVERLQCIRGGSWTLNSYHDSGGLRLTLAWPPARGNNPNAITPHGIWALVSPLLTLRPLLTLADINLGKHKYYVLWYLVEQLSYSHTNLSPGVSSPSQSHQVIVSPHWYCPNSWALVWKTITGT